MVQTWHMQKWLIIPKGAKKKVVNCWIIIANANSRKASVTVIINVPKSYMG